MRTTLKRGIGRGAAFNGDGKAVLPPGALSPVARYRQPPPPPRSGMRTVAKVLGWIGVVLLMLAGGLILLLVGYAFVENFKIVAR